MQHIQVYIQYFMEMNMYISAYFYICLFLWLPAYPDKKLHI